MILLIDNHDSFVYNLSRYCEELGYQAVVKRCDKISLKDIQLLAPTHIIISPGPCGPEDAGISMSCISAFSATIPILGVCLGHQAIAAVFGATVERSTSPMHGKPDFAHHNDQGIFFNLPNPMSIGRYHSLMVNQNLPDCLDLIAANPDGLVMAIQHKLNPTVGVQFHPESILTPDGKTLLKNFLAGEISRLE
tara:strand:- start:30842 stop:31420 length:579 start_codon:yes stop_codon:yes gene_type:complete